MSVNLKYLRQNKGLTQDKISKLIGISKSYYVMLESHTRTPSVKLAQKLSKILNFPWEDFFNSKEVKLKEQRQLKELSVDDICILTQIDKNRYIAVENGLETPTKDELNLLKTILNF